VKPRPPPSSVIPNIIVVYDFNQVDHTYYIAMEFVDGIDLDQMVRDAGSSPG